MTGNVLRGVTAVPQEPDSDGDVIYYVGDAVVGGYLWARDPYHALEQAVSGRITEYKSQGPEFGSCVAVWREGDLVAGAAPGDPPVPLPQDHRKDMIARLIDSRDLNADGSLPATGEPLWR